MVQLENELLKVSIAEKGAELQGIFRKDVNMEYLWSGNPAFWAKKSPVLFPVVGGLKNNRYTYEGKTYELGRHGFARDKVFTVTAQTAASAGFTLLANEETLQHYPFNFRFTIHYTLQQATLQVTYEVENTGDTTMLFSVGGHPAFKVPLSNDTGYEDYYLQFEAVENAGRWPLSPEGLIEQAPDPLLTNSDTLHLNKPLFYADALVLKNLVSRSVTLKCEQHAHGLHFNFKDFPYLGIWSAKDADFVCIEPCCGLADSVNASGELAQKEGIEQLPAHQTFRRTWDATFF